MVKVDLRTVTLNVPPQEVITKDNVPVRVNAVAYFRIVDANAAIVQVENYMVATSQIAQTTLRSVLGQHVLDETLSERDKINATSRRSSTTRLAVGNQGLRGRGEGRRVPSMQRAMATQAEAEREQRAKVIRPKASSRRRAAEGRAAVMARSLSRFSSAICRRCWSRAEKNSTIVFPIPIEILKRSRSRATRTAA